MFEKVNMFHSDKIADRIAGAIVDLAYKKERNPRVAVEVLIGHGKCHIINETSVKLDVKAIKDIVERIAERNIDVDYVEVPQDEHLAENQRTKIRCGDNGIFKGVVPSGEERDLTHFAELMSQEYPFDGKYLIDNKGAITICQSHYHHDDESDRKALDDYMDMAFGVDWCGRNVNPLGDWTGGTDVDTGATNRKLGSDMGRAATGGGLCLSGDSQFLSDDYKWYDIKDYKSGQKVAQWNNGDLEFVVPTAYIHNPKEKLYHIYNNSKLSMCLTPDHEILVKTSKNNLIKKKAKDVIPNLIKGIGDAGKIPHTFYYYVKDGINYDYYETCLQVAFCADGSILGDSNKKWRGRIRVKKQYKKERLRELFKSAKKEYKETFDGEYSIFWFTPLFENKSLYECFKNCGIYTLDAVADEVFKWDGDAKRKLFRTTIKEDADFVQFLLARRTYCATIQYSEKKNYYTVHELLSSYTALRKSKNTPIKVEETEGESYCFNVPSHNLIIRHNDRIFITGNCGKDLSKADVAVNIYAHLKALKENHDVELSCSIGDEYVDGLPYAAIVEIARDYIDRVGGFEKFAEWGLLR